MEMIEANKPEKKKADNKMNSAPPPPPKKKKFSADSCFALAPLFELNVASQ